MSLLFQSPMDLLGDRYDLLNGKMVPDKYTAAAELSSIDSTGSFLDLILHPPETKNSMGHMAEFARATGQYIPKFYRIKAVVGWSIPKGKFPD